MKSDYLPAAAKAEFQTVSSSAKPDAKDFMNKV
jgi:hypothetical protein